MVERKRTLPSINFPTGWAGTHFDTHMVKIFLSGPWMNMNPSTNHSAGFFSAESWASSADETSFMTKTQGDENPCSKAMAGVGSVIVPVGGLNEHPD